jgi:hypothetical protein
MFGVLPYIVVYGVDCHTVSQISNCVCKHRLQLGQVNVYVALRAKQK